MGKYQGRCQLVLKPSTTDAISQILAYCSLRRLALVPQGGNTGLVGGSVPVFDEIVLNMSNMNKIISFDPVRQLIADRHRVPVLQLRQQVLQGAHSHRQGGQAHDSR